MQAAQALHWCPLQPLLPGQQRVAVPVPVVGHRHSRNALQACRAKQRSVLHAVSERPDLQTAAERLAEEIEAESVREETADTGPGIEEDAQLQVQLLALQQQVRFDNALCCPRLRAKHTLLTCMRSPSKPGLHHW